MFQIRHSRDDRWIVIDRHEQPVFEGTLRECEDWLDLRENEARHRAAGVAPESRFLAAVRRLVAGLFGRTREPQPADQHAETQEMADGAEAEHDVPATPSTDVRTK
jgi:hypothetical protein